MELEINLNLKGIKQPELRKIVEKINICVILDYEIKDNEFILRDDYVFHKNADYNTIPLSIPLERVKK